MRLAWFTGAHRGDDAGREITDAQSIAAWTLLRLNTVR